MSNESVSQDKAELYLICDLDGTLLKNDFFSELFIASLLKSPLKTILSIKKGLVNLKHDMLDQHEPNIEATLNTDVVALIKNISPHFKKTILLSASTDVFTKKVGSLLGIFDECHGTSTINLKGINKLKYIQDNNFKPFVYIGDSKADNIIFKEAEYFYKIQNHKPVLHK